MTLLLLKSYLERREAELQVFDLSFSFDLLFTAPPRLQSLAQSKAITFQKEKIQLQAAKKYDRLELAKILLCRQKEIIRAQNAPAPHGGSLNSEIPLRVQGRAGGTRDEAQALFLHYSQQFLASRSRATLYCGTHTSF